MDSYYLVNTNQFNVLDMKKIVGCFVLMALLFSCGGNQDNRPLKDYLSAFLTENESIIAFGKVDLNTILNKSEYKSIPKIGVILDAELKAYQRILNRKAPVYFALEGPLLEDGVPTTSYVFLEVLNEDSLATKLTQQGFDLNKSDDFQFFQSGDISLGIRNNLAVLIFKKEDFDGEKLLSQTFDKVKRDVSGGKIAKILSANGDVVFGLNISNLYATSNTDLSDLNEEKQKNLQDLVADSYIQTTISFDKGSAVLETKNLFSEKLESKLFFKSDATSSIIANLGTGKPTLGVSMNIDMKKLQAFMDEYSPNTLKDFAEIMGGEFQMALAMGGDAGLAGLINGQLAAVMVGEPNAQEGLSDFNLFVGLGKNGRTLAEGFQSLLSIGMAKVELNKKGLSAFSSLNYVPKSGESIVVPEGCEIFGRKGITAFLNFEGVDLTSFEFENEQKLIYLIKYVTFEMDEHGSKLLIQAKNGKENVLKQIVDLLVIELSQKINKMAV